ncbi:MAG: hypothetical protein KAT49_02720 [Methanomicrobia archaeon]|nr:hypothetical protein [Methanomicrobia archaeon]MCK4636775.1 hypothetical protein [Methanomicrobia archaeon]
MIIVITGAIHMGKTTILKKLITNLKKKICGVISEAIEDGFLVEDLKTKEKKVLASKNKIGFKFRGYYFDPEAITFVENALKRKGEILVYDEIGYLEMKGFLDIFRYLKKNSVVIVREDILQDILKKIEDYRVFTVTKENRDVIGDDILALCNNIF